MLCARRCLFNQSLFQVDALLCPIQFTRINYTFQISLHIVIYKVGSPFRVRLHKIKIMYIISPVNYTNGPLQYIFNGDLYKLQIAVTWEFVSRVGTMKRQREKDPCQNNIISFGEGNFRVLLKRKRPGTWNMSETFCVFLPRSILVADGQWLVPGRYLFENFLTLKCCRLQVCLLRPRTDLIAEFIIC